MLFRSVPQHQWLSVASLYFSGHAALWWQAYKRCYSVVNWEGLCAAIVQEFGQDEYDIHMSKLLQLRQSGSVMEYRTAFESIMYQLISLDPSLNTKFFVSQFVRRSTNKIQSLYSSSTSLHCYSGCKCVP